MLLIPQVYLIFAKSHRPYDFFIKESCLSTDFISYNNGLVIALSFSLVCTVNLSLPYGPMGTICIAHRGASGYEQENSIASFQRAIEMGSTWIELDVQNVEGSAIVFHDRELMRLTGTAGSISTVSLNALRKLVLPNGEKIPLLQEVFTKLQGKVALQIELKGFGAAEAVSTEISRALEAGWSTSQILVSSFDHEELHRFNGFQPEIPLGLLIYGYPLDCVQVAQTLDVTTVHMRLPFVSKERIASLQKSGFQVFVYTVNDPREISYLVDLKVDGIFTDYPDRVLSVTTQLP